MPRRQDSTAQKVFIGVLVVLTSLCVTFIILYVPIPQRNTAPVTTNEVMNTPLDEARVAAISSPSRLNIAKIGVSAVISPVGLTDEGDMDIDDNPEQLAWYKLGPKPGEEGSAVIAGHYGWKNGVASVFNDLSTLVKGDKISTVDENGQVLTFIVSRTALYDPEQDATEVFRSDDGKAHLNLITCQGSWNNAQSTYSDRLVVFSELAKHITAVDNS